MVEGNQVHHIAITHRDCRRLPTSITRASRVERFTLSVTANLRLLAAEIRCTLAADFRC